MNFELYGISGLRALRIIVEREREREEERKGGESEGDGKRTDTNRHTVRGKKGCRGEYWKSITYSVMELLPQVEAAEARTSDDEYFFACPGGLHGHGHLGHEVDREVVMVINRKGVLRVTGAGVTDDGGREGGRRGGKRERKSAVHFRAC